jgi:hypothetical protein
MSSKKFKGKTCVYCCAPNASETADHVVARQFALERQRDGLPKVPACRRCNGEKSALETYLTTVLPFGGMHDDASEMLQSMVEKRLEKNPRLTRELSAGQTYRIERVVNGVLIPSMTIPLDHEPLRQLYEYIARGLAFVRWGLLLPPETCIVHAEFLSSAGQGLFLQLFGLGMQQRVSDDFGNGLFVYEAGMAKEPNELTVWRMSLYGARLADHVAGESVSDAFVLTAPRRMKAAHDLVSLMRQPRAA